MKSRNNKILCIADLHVMSNFGLCLEEFAGENGVVYKASKGQLRLLRYWKHLCKTVKENEAWRVSKVWVIGDVFAGRNPIERGRYIRGTLDDQVKMATEILKMLPEEVELYVWSGTSYHESIDLQMHERLVEQLKLEGRKAVFRGAWSFEKIGDTTAFVTHHASGAVVYPEIPMLRDSRWFKVQHFDGKLPEIRWIIRADKHVSKFVDDRNIYIIQVPCWQTLVPFKSALRMFPMWQSDIGACFVWVENGRRRYQEWLYPPFIIDSDGRIVETEYEKTRYVSGW